jgi:hypothetical protein
MDFQIFFNIVLGAFSTLAGWTLNNLYQAMKDLSKADEMLTDKIQAIEVLVAGAYIRREEFEAKMTQLYSKLDRIDDKLTALKEVHSK